MSSSSPASSSESVDKDVKKKRVMVGLPGQEYSSQFLISWTKFLVELMKDGTLDISLFPGFSKNSMFSRMKTLNLNKQEVQIKAFDGVDYDVFVTIDPTVVFNFEQFKTLVSMTEQYPAVSAMYYTSEKTVNAIENMDYDNFVKTGSFAFLSIDELKDKKLVKVDYTSLGFFACRRNVLQALDYPYFWYPLVDYTTEDGTPCKDVLSDEVAFCRRLCDKGFRIMLNVELRVYNEEKIVI